MKPMGRIRVPRGAAPHSKGLKQKNCYIHPSKAQLQAKNVLLIHSVQLLHALISIKLLYAYAKQNFKESFPTMALKKDDDSGSSLIQLNLEHDPPLSPRPPAEDHWWQCVAKNGGRKI